jgi:DHA2 family lincomycin resistance protein-like MFS transporter
MISSSLAPRRPGAVKAVLLVTSFVAMLNETSINVALSALMGVFGVSVTTVQWLVTAFMLVMAVVVPMTAYLLARFTTRTLYFVSLVCLGVGSLLAGLAPGFEVLLAGRIIQAAGTCVLMSLTVTTVIQLTPHAERGGAMGLVGLVTLFAPAVAPTIGGLILQLAGWNWIFLGPLPLFVVVAILATFLLENVTTPVDRKLDILSVLLSVAAFGGILLGLGVMDQVASNPLLVWSALGVGIVALVLFVVRQLTIAEPLVDLRVFRYPQFSMAMVFVFFSIISVFGITMLTPMALGQVWGLGAAAAGMSMLPGGILNGLTAPVFGQLYDKIGPRILVVCGSILMLCCMAGLAFLPASAPVGLYIGLHIVFLLGVSAVMTVNQANGVNELPAPLYPHGTATMSTLMQLGGGVGTALFISLLASGQNRGAEAAFHGAFGWGALLLILPLVVSFFLKKSVHPAD